MAAVKEVLNECSRGLYAAGSRTSATRARIVFTVIFTRACRPARYGQLQRGGDLDDEPDEQRDRGADQQNGRRNGKHYEHRESYVTSHGRRGQRATPAKARPRRSV
jgi:hypothetical protein